MQLGDDALILHRNNRFKLFFLYLSGNLLDDGFPFGIGAENLLRDVLHVDNALFLDGLAHRALDRGRQHRRIHIHGCCIRNRLRDNLNRLFR